MAAYEAIRDSFREFNRTLIDSQQWNAQHESRMADQQLKETMLKNQLNQQTFSNRMKQEQIRLAGESNKLGAARLAETIRNNDRQFIFNEKKFNEELEVEKNRINGLNTDRDTKNKLMADRNRELKETADLNQEEARLKNAELVRQADLTAQSNELTTAVIPPKYQSNPVVMDKLKDQVLMKYGGSVTEDGVVLDKQGNELQIPMHEYRSMKFQADAMMAAYDNKPSRAQSERDILARGIASKKSSVSTMTSTYDQPKAAGMKRQIKVMEAEVEKRSRYLASLDTPQGQAKNLREQAKDIRLAAGALNAKGKGNDPDTAAQYIALANAKDAEATAIMVAERRRLLEVAKGEGGTPDKTLVTRVEKLYKTAIAPSDSMFDTLSGDTKNAISTLKNLVRNDAKERGIDLSTEQSYDNLIGEQKSVMIEAHNKLAGMYQNKEAISSQAEFDTWVRETYRPKLRRLGFEYDPKEDYREQIGQSD